MNDHDGPNDGGREGRGPGGPEFLDLELTQMLFAEGERMAKAVALDLMREAIRERLAERLGDQLAAIGHLAADELADDVEANLAIEARIGERQAAKSDLAERLAAALAAQPTKKRKKGR